ncbi:hypothetical protein Mp_1g23720 [Marchantia polymorpha subsp. ruderalis]|uniref:Uncharacterized protein n=2 Tax=Marchantia polymorpha TaxID=3197 RepID=A0AAF6ATK3_MARPO|nr:hypothetical protein MARPO_0065s0005 [Marchantia polymorpha]BBM99773.1 hypothetical protein Mp_1g23720 [Marchantia polymorpha subsp. ruderalis]|eukprot:PTQ36182.1 hypothetical protein MARPO_0065s0005 [Marchantia polymorpha]
MQSNFRAKQQILNRKVEGVAHCRSGGDRRLSDVHLDPPRPKWNRREQQNRPSNRKAPAQHRTGVRAQSCRRRTENQDGRPRSADENGNSLTRSVRVSTTSGPHVRRPRGSFFKGERGKADEGAGKRREGKARGSGRGRGRGRPVLHRIASPRSLAHSRASEDKEQEGKKEGRVCSVVTKGLGSGSGSGGGNLRSSFVRGEWASLRN